MKNNINQYNITSDMYFITLGDKLLTYDIGNTDQYITLYNYTIPLSKVTTEMVPLSDKSIVHLEQPIRVFLQIPHWKHIMSLGVLPLGHHLYVCAVTCDPPRLHMRKTFPL